ncbi:MAG: hypothetical protein KIT57_03625 [Blastocatellales bacterium]|nr:hypothetical protein [Blastocatellales bacterium]
MTTVERAIAPLFEPANFARIQNALCGEMKRLAERSAAAFAQIPPEVRERFNREVELMGAMNGAAGRAVAPVKGRAARRLRPVD